MKARGWLVNPLITITTGVLGSFYTQSIELLIQLQVITRVKYNPLIIIMKARGWLVNPLITITTGVLGSFYTQSIELLIQLQVPPKLINKTMKNNHHIAI